MKTMHTSVFYVLQNGGVFQHFGQAFNPMHEAAVRSAIEMLQSYGVNSVSNFVIVMIKINSDYPNVRCIAYEKRYYSSKFEQKIKVQISFGPSVP